MTKTQATAQVFWTAFQALPHEEQQLVLRRAVQDEDLRRHLMNLLLQGIREPAKQVPAKRTRGRRTERSLPTPPAGTNSAALRPILRLFDGFDHTSPDLRDEVQELQTELNKQGLTLAVNGLFDTDTESAVKAFQKKRGMEETGIVDASTWAALLGIEPPDPTTLFPTTFARNDPAMLKDLEEANKYKTFVEEAAVKFGYQPSVIAGIGSRESDWGLTLKPAGSGPAGTGDFGKRRFPMQFRDAALPPDGGGFGRGLMQIDYDWHEFARGEKWKDPRENIFYACSLLARNRDWLEKKTGLEGMALLRAAISAYNCGPGNALKAIQNGLDIDFFTTGRHYSDQVLNRAGWFQLHGWR